MSKYNSNQVYKVTVTKQQKIIFLITIYVKYCNSKKVLCDDIKNLLSSVCKSSLLACFIKKKELPKLYKLKEYRMM